MRAEAGKGCRSGGFEVRAAHDERRSRDRGWGSTVLLPRAGADRRWRTPGMSQGAVGEGAGFAQRTVAARDDNHIGFLPRGRIDWGSRRLPAGAVQGWLMLGERSPYMNKTLFCGVDLHSNTAM